MSRRHLIFSALLAAGLVAGAGTVSAADIRIVNQDVGTKKGLDDPTPTSAVGGNPGKTRGEQALIVFRFAADLWGAVLKSDVPIINNATFKELACTADTGVLGSAGTKGTFFFKNPPPAGALSGVWYHSALSDALAGEDIDAGEADIQSRFNGKMGSSGCMEGMSWYFGLDGKTPSGQINFLNVVLHEMAHGLGFSGFNNLATGQQLEGDDDVRRPDIYSTFVFDNTQNKKFYDLTENERIASVRNDDNLVFTGRLVTVQAPDALQRTSAVRISAPAAAAGSYEFSQATFGPAATDSNFTGPIVQAVSGANLYDSCAVLTNAAELSGRIALIDRGNCEIVSKALKAQAAGATGVLLVNDRSGVMTPGGGLLGRFVTIPVGMVSQLDGNELKANLVGLTANGVGLGDTLAGADAEGRVKLYAPTTLARGSSFSHYDTRLTPNALMEYAINESLVGQIDLDLTPALFQDLGWKLNYTTQKLLTCDSGIPTLVPGGVIIGANVLGNAKTAAAGAASLADYRTAMQTYAANLAANGLITQAQASSLNACLSDAELQKQYTAWGSGGGTPAEPTAVALSNGVTLSGQSGAADGVLVYKLDVPAGARALNLRTFGGSGDVSLYVKLGSIPTATDNTYRSERSGNSQSVVVARPAAGTYYLKLIGVKAFAGVSVQGNYTVP
ncbi:PA domain-containing protein [Dyella silvatica]|uniref:PA domain-containing protein n=1 Tax=Dyella silvatica TaxID=2992128 RepID=UPI00225B3B16|nr:PA domain-containing protein [Dyella silvatica]